MTNKPKAPQNNAGTRPTSIAATRAPALSQTHNNSRSRARCCHIFSKDAKPKTHAPLTHDLELTRGCRRSFQGFSDDLRAPDTQIAGQRRLRRGLDVWCVSRSSSRAVETQRGARVLLRGPPDHPPTAQRGETRPSISHLK